MTRTTSCARAVMALTCVLAGPAAGQEVPEAPAEQIRWALSAGPAHIRDDATVYVLGVDGYHVAREGTNGFHCLVERWEREVVTPICYDDVGAASTLRAVFYLEERRAEAVPETEIHAEIEQGYESGRFIAPESTGIAYMLAPDSPAPPHVMYYAPYATNEEFRGAPGSARGVLPFIYGPGGPRSYIVQLVDARALEALNAGR